MSPVVTSQAVGTSERASVRACPVCDSTRGTVLLEKRYGLFDDSALPRDTSIVRCEECPMVYARSMAGADAYRSHYTLHSKYDTSVGASGSGESPFDERRLRDTAAFLGTAWSRTATILDIGAGRGGLLSALRRHGFARLAGVDPSSGCVGAMRGEGFVAACGTLEDGRWDLPCDAYDGVVLSHVLEHVYDVDGAFARVAGCISAAGEIYIEMPDASRYTIEGFPAFYFFDPEHINHFEPHAIAALAERHGWSVASWCPRWIDLHATQRYPAIGALLRRASTAQSPVEPHGAPLEAYIEASRAALDASAPLRAVARIVRAHEPMVLWGAGSHAQRLLSLDALGGANIDCIIDSDPGKLGRSLDGHRVVARDEGLARARACGATIVVAIAVDPQPVVDFVRSHAPDLLVLAP